MGINYLVNEELRLPTRAKRAMNDLLLMWRLQAARVAMGQSPSDDMESLFSDLRQMVTETRPNILSDVNARMSAPASYFRTNRVFAAFAGVDLDDPRSLRSVDIGGRHVNAVRPLIKSWIDVPPMVPNLGRLTPEIDRFRLLPQAEHRGLKILIQSVKCYDETGWGPQEWWNEDEIYCGAVAVDETGETSFGGLFKVGDFDDGDLKTYTHPGKSIQYFNIHEGGDTFPKVYTIPIVLIEHDYGNLPEWMNKFLNAVKEKVQSYLTTILGGLIGSSLGPLGSFVGAIVGWAVGKAISMVKGWLGDELLGTATIGARINSYTGNWIGSGTDVSNIYSRDYHGGSSHYRLNWRAQLV